MTTDQVMPSPSADATETTPLRVFIIAGEHSGDALGAKLMPALRAAHAGPIHFIGVGGEHMASQGFSTLYPLSQIAVMGPLAILKRLPSLVSKVYQTVDAVIAADPDILVIIDAPEFTHPIASRVRRRRPDIPIVDYVSPTVWAWRPGRARKMRSYVDHVLALLPFEPAAHLELGGPPCTYVGHPLTERLPAIAALDTAPFARRLGLAADQPVLLVLPGSRRSEVERLTAVFGETVARLRGRHPSLQVLIPAMPGVVALIGERIAAWPAAAGHPIVFAGEVEADKFAAFKLARAALAASGTVTLELALTRTPMVVAYRVDVIISTLRHLIKAKSAVLPNLITGSHAIPEFLQEPCTAENLAAALDPLLHDSPERTAQLAQFDRVPHILALQAGTPSEAAARVVLEQSKTRGPAPSPAKA
jgi:lipid-A-disaccharide synthase